MSYPSQTFESIRHSTEDGYEFWSARDLAKVLQYSEYRHFVPVIKKAIKACKKSKKDVDDHFEEVLEMVTIGSGAIRPMRNYRLSRYACYLIIQNADPSKDIVAAGQTYFAIQVRRQELADDEAFQQLDEDKKRVYLRDELREHNKQLQAAASRAGLKTSVDFAIFHNSGYRGLYGGLDKKKIHKRKKLRGSQEILDHMGSTELAANLFRTTQTEEKLSRDKIKGKNKAHRTHFEVGQKVRGTIEELGGTMPEDLPTPRTSVKSLERRHRKQLTKGKRNTSD